MSRNNAKQTQAKVGRPTDYTSELATEICNAIACNSKGIKRLCKENPGWPSAFTIFKWLKENNVFSEQYARAKVVQITLIVDEMLDIAFDAEDVNKARLEIDTRKWLACKLMPKVYGNKVDARVDVGMSHDDWVIRMWEESRKNKEYQVITQ